MLGEMPLLQYGNVARLFELRAGALEHPEASGQSSPGWGEQYALRLKQPLLAPHHVESDCCPNCKRLIIDAAAYESNLP